MSPTEILLVKVGDIVVLKKNTRFYADGQEYVLYRIDKHLKYRRFTGGKEYVDKYILVGPGMIPRKVDLDEISHTVVRIEKKAKTKDKIKEWNN